MAFDIHLELPTRITPEPDDQIRYYAEADDIRVGYDPESDDVTSILADICHSLQNVPGARFVVVVGEPIRASIRRDLDIMMEQLVDVLSGLCAGRPVHLDLYEQGIEARLTFTADGDRMIVERHDLLGRPKPSWRLELPRDVVIGMLRDLGDTFLNAARTRAPERAAHPWFTEWARVLVAAMNQSPGGRAPA